jgi:hypothetical protein
VEIQIVSVSRPESVNRGNKAWQEVNVEYIGKTGPGKRTIRSFEGDVYTAVQALKEGDGADVTVVKEGKYWNWKGIAKTGNGAANGTGATAQLPLAAAKKGDWETKEERADRQHYIVRQSSIANAIATLSEADRDVNEVLRIAAAYEEWVFTGNLPPEQPVKRGRKAKAEVAQEEME